MALLDKAQRFLPKGTWIERSSNGSIVIIEGYCQRLPEGDIYVLYRENGDPTIYARPIEVLLQLRGEDPEDVKGHVVRPDWNGR